ncbi:hypothetical protein [Ichthyenterobacterium magnum]|uniref:Uncharacterized protein n=1 Tax=Ichthyenterobacterium magnum TaxID=1230530 RepID=A0A420DVC3_9FLAO|nr:hypothetical protein [Ichthyenterobacterium magnum]RKE98169.1 hypothetical protein BXY80_0244 [Ichthyenterobacterium magnum]
MKPHSKRKFVGDIKVDFKFDELDKVNEYAKKPSEVDFEEYPKVFMQLEDQTIIQGFVHLIDGKPFMIPEPEPSILYFTNAEDKLNTLLNLQSILLESNLTTNNFSDLSHAFYNFFQLSSDYIINLFTSIEAFNNSLIPDDFSIRIKNENYNKERIQRSMDFLNKIKKAIPQIMNKSFLKEYHKKYEFLLDIKKLRDNVVHTKNMQSGFPASYRELYKSYLNFDFKKSYEITKEYFNFYKDDWIEDCNCGR